MGWEAEGRFKGEGTDGYLWLTQVDKGQKPTQHCKAIILQLKINKCIPPHFCTFPSALFLLNKMVKNPWSRLRVGSRKRRSMRLLIKYILLERDKRTPTDLS